MVTIYQMSISGNITSTMPKASPIVYISPIVGFASLLLNQVGLGGQFNSMFSEFGISMHSEYISIVIQLILSAIFIYLAATKLNPLNKKIKVKSKKVKE